jgi:hypothetical protein
MPFTAEVITLTADERAELEQMAQSRTLPAGDVFRARLVLMLADGLPYRIIQERLDTTVESCDADQSIALQRELSIRNCSIFGPSTARDLLGVFRLEFFRFVFQFCRGSLVFLGFALIWHRPLSCDIPRIWGIVLIRDFHFAPGFREHITRQFRGARSS